MFRVNIPVSLDLSLQVNSIYVHTKTNNKYQLLMLTNLMSTKPNFIPTAVYKALGSNVIWSRPISEFCDNFHIEE